MLFRAKEMLKKARQERTWQPSDNTFKVARTRRIPEVIGGAQYWRKKIMLYDRIALERHDYTATRTERLQKAKNWVLRLNADGPQKPLRQRQEFADTSTQCLKIQDAHVVETEQTQIPIRRQHQQRQRQKSANQKRRKLRLLCRSQDWRYFTEPRRNPRGASSSSSSTSQWPTSQWQTS